MNSRPRVLLIAEGERAEALFFSRLFGVFGIGAEIVAARANIYLLYKRMKEADFNLDVKGAVAEMNVSEKGKKLLEGRFAYTYLVFDFDAHHRQPGGGGRPGGPAVTENMDALAEMAAYFTDETDPTVGRLYLNYPMMESYRDADDFFEDAYATRAVPVSEIHRYKELVAVRKLCRRHVKDFTREQFCGLARMNLFKMNSLGGRWGPMPYPEYLAESPGGVILEKERECVAAGAVSVLNTSLFFLFDYFGNRGGFYDSVVNRPSGRTGKGG